jgi:ribose 5-phosphate isomerase A
MTPQDAEKRLAASRAVELVQSGMRVGLGSGSTSAHMVRLLGQRIQQEGLKILAVPTSRATRDLALEVGIPLQDDLSGFELDLAIDGVDQVTRAGWIIKGGGGAMLQERIVAAAARRFIVMADSSKLVERLGGFPLPVEVVPLGWKNVERKVAALGGNPRLRTDPQGRPRITDQGNYILDCDFSSQSLTAPHPLARTLRDLPGVADHGLFLGMAERLIIARGDQCEEIVLPQAADES